MAAQKQPHEILGVPADADLIQVSIAYKTTEERWSADRNPGNDIAAFRLRRATEAFTAMALAHGFRPMDGDEIIPPAAPPVFNNRAERAEHFQMRMRIGGLISRFNQYVELNEHDIDELKAEQGLRFTFLKAAMRRREEDKAVYRAERCLRAAQAEILDNYALRDLKNLLNGFRMHVNAGRFDRIMENYVVHAEREVEQRYEQVETALAVIKRAGKQAAPRVP